MPIFIAAAFIGWYFYKSALNIGKNGYLWVGIAFAAFLSVTFLTNLVIRYLLKSVFEIDPQDNLLIGFIFSMVTGVASLSVVNNFMNKIPD